LAGLSPQTNPARNLILNMNHLFQQYRKLLQITISNRGNRGNNQVHLDFEVAYVKDWLNIGNT